MALLEKFRQLAEAHEALVRTSKDPFRVTIERILSPTEAIVNGRRMILAGTNNYLGLTFDPECLDAAARAVYEQGTGTTGSRMANGSFNGHAALEHELADFYGRRWCVVFSTGYLANLGVISALTGQEDVILIDADCHASIYDGCRMSGAEVIRFHHNDPGDLHKRLRRLGERRTNTLIIVEGIYSMLGDQAPLSEFVALKKEYGAYLLLDEAHSLGVLGEHGRGLSDAAHVESGIDFIVGTFSKSLGATGGFCVSDHHEMELTRYVSRPYIFTASLCPSVIASTRAAPADYPDPTGARTRLWSNARRLYDRLKELGFSSTNPESDCRCVVRATRGGDCILERPAEQGVYVNMIPPPPPRRGKPASLQRQRGPYRGADRPHLSSLRVPQGVLMGREGPISEHWGRPVDFFQSDRTVMLKAEPSGDMALRR
jgi:8-amino-7-oxononanoate synthase